MRKSLEFGQTKLWVWCQNYLAPLSGIGLQKGRVLVKIKFEFDLNSVKRFPLCIFIISTRKGFCMVGQHQYDHFDMVLQTMQKYHGA